MKKTKKAVEIPSLEQLGRELERCRNQSRFRRTLWSTVAVLLFVAAVSVLLTMLVLPVYRIFGSSMSPTLQNGEIVLAVKGGHYRRGDLVAFYYGNKLLIKRVIGEPENMLDIRDDGDVYLDGELLEEPYVTQKAPGDSDMEYPLRVPEEHWFLLGDQRSISVDSRNQQIGCVSADQIVGRVFLRIWPLNKAGFITNGTKRGGA